MIERSKATSPVKRAYSKTRNVSRFTVRQVRALEFHPRAQRANDERERVSREPIGNDWDNAHGECRQELDRLSIKTKDSAIIHVVHPLN